MKTEWMGRYRPLVAALVRHSNGVVRGQGSKREYPEGISLSSTEWQVLEYIVEHENDDDCMLFISESLGIPQSTFSKAVKTLSSLGLIDRYQMINNRKNIILKPTKRGSEVYETRAQMIYEKNFKPFFEALETVDDETLGVIVNALNILNTIFDKPQYQKDKLVKLE